MRMRCSELQHQRFFAAAAKRHGIMADLSSRASDEILQEASRKKAIAQAKKLFEVTKQAPSPSKDYVQLLVTERGVVQRRIPITVRGVTQGAVPAPTERVLTLEEFEVDGDFQGDVRRIFGNDALKKVKRIASGNWDIFLRLGEDLVVKIVTLLDLQSIENLARVNRHFREVCQSNKLWEALYKTHQGWPSHEITALARELGWRTVFFMNRLQLQKELSRRRKNISDGDERADASENLSPDNTFLTES